MKAYIYYLNYEIQREKITLQDVNFKLKGKIAEIIYNEESNKIIYKYASNVSASVKHYEVSLEAFIENIYIYNTDIFYLGPIYFNRENTPNFNDIKLITVEVNTLFFAVPQNRPRINDGLMSTFSNNALKRKASPLVQDSEKIRKIIEAFNSRKRTSGVTGGNNAMIKIIRKVYTDNKNRKYIKYNKNTIIYLKS